MKLGLACRRLAQVSNQITCAVDPRSFAPSTLGSFLANKTFGIPGCSRDQVNPRRHPHHPKAMSSATAPSAPTSMADISYLGQEAAQKLDEDLMGPLGFSVDQLMELAGLSVACSIAAEYPPASFSRVVVLAGPGNNGGDGIVAARHLHHFGYRVAICYPKRTDRPLYHGLVTQCSSLGIDFIDHDTLLQAPLSTQADIVIDAMFGFSFKGAPRPPFDALIAAITPAATPLPAVVSVDIPSGWDVEKGDVGGAGIRPDMLVSLTTPKLCAKGFTGPHHYLGGRFVPPEIIRKYRLRLPAYPGTEQCIKLSPDATQPSPAVAPDVAAMRQHYGAGGEGLEEHSVAADPWDQFLVWFEEARACEGVKEANAMALATVGPDAAPSLRMVLLKGFSPRGLTFYTNFSSRKGRELEGNPLVAATFFWEALERQVRFEGRVERLSDEESDAYWHSRPRGSQIGALASRQSEIVPGGRAELEQREAEAAAAHPEGKEPIPRPQGWGGFLVRPTVIEFWQGRPSRLHDRLQYTKQRDGTWVMARLSP